MWGGHRGGRRESRNLTIPRPAISLVPFFSSGPVLFSRFLTAGKDDGSTDHRAASFFLLHLLSFPFLFLPLEKYYHDIVHAILQILLKRNMPPIKSNRGGCFRNTYRQTLWTACATVIVGVALMALGLLMTVVGYFDSNLFSSGEPLLVTTDSDSKVAVQGKGNGPDSAFGWLRLLLKSMQYVGPVLMGIGMFLMIIACVMTLESRDRHAQIIQEESTELRRSRRQTVQRTRSERSRTNDGDEMVKENGAATGLKREDPEKRSAIMRTNQSQLLVRAEVHPWSAPIRPTRPPVDFSLISEASSTDAMGEYTFPNIKTSLSGGGGGRKRREAEPKMPMRDETKGAETGEGGERRGMEPAEGQHQQRHMALAGPRRKSSSAIVRINRNTPRGPAPLVRFESLIELSIAGSSPPSTFGSPRKKGQI